MAILKSHAIFLIIFLVDSGSKSQLGKDICVTNSEPKKRPSIFNKKPSVESNKGSVLEKESVIVKESIIRKGSDPKCQSVTRKNTASESLSKKQSVAKKVSVSRKEHLSRENTITLAESSGDSKYESCSNKNSSISEIESVADPAKQAENQNAKLEEQENEGNENVKLNNTFDESNLTLSEEEAAIRIQSVVRGHLTRASMKVSEDIPESSTKKDELCEETNADRTIEEVPKGTNVVEAATIGEKSKQMEEKIGEATLDALAENKVNSENDSDLEKAAVKIQSNFRGHQARKEVEIIKSGSTRNVAEPENDDETAHQEGEIVIDDSRESEKLEKLPEEETKAKEEPLIAQEIAEGEPTPVESGSSKDLSEASSNDEQGQEKSSEEIEKKTEELPKLEAILTQAPAVELVREINSTDMTTKERNAGDVEDIVEEKSDKVESEPEAAGKSSFGHDVTEQSINATAPTSDEAADNKSSEEQIPAQPVSIGQINTEEPAAETAATESITDSTVKYPVAEVPVNEQNANTITEEGTHQTQRLLAEAVELVTTGDSSANQSTKEPEAQPLPTEDLTTKEKIKEPKTVEQPVETELKAEQPAPHPPKTSNKVEKPTETAADLQVAEPETMAENKDDVINDCQEEQTEKNIDIEGNNNTNMEAETFDENETVSDIEKNDP